jgi:O-antigen/teichoic acid export membrane protein
MNKSRTKLSTYNSIFASVSQLLSLLVSFASRTIFIKVLGEHYLGLNGLFMNILNLVSFAELGIGAAITYSLYEPIAKKNESAILGLMQLYRRVYHAIAGIVLVIGLLITPFLKFLINGSTQNVGNIYIAFILFLLNTVFSYLWNYKRSIFFANQEGYINSLNTLVFQVGAQIIQIIFLFVYPSYYLYLIIQLLLTVFSNLQISKLADKKYPFLKSKKKVGVPSKVIDYIKRNVIGMVSSKLGGIVVNGTDNILLSVGLGLGTVGIYSNYTLILNGMNSVINQGISAVTASIGNMQVTENKEKQKIIFYKYSHLSSLIGIFISVGLSSFFSPFISLWVGKNYLLTPITTWTIVLGFFVAELRQANINFTNAYGLYWEQRKKPIFESIVNLFFSVIFLFYMDLGIKAVILGTLLSNLLVNLWWEPFIVIRFGINGKLKEYFKYYFAQLFFGVIIFTVSQYISSQFSVDYFWLHIVITIGLLVVSTLLFDYIVSKFLPECVEGYSAIRGVLKRIRGRL